MRIEPVEITYNFVAALNRKFQGIETPAGPIQFSAEHGGKQRGQFLDRIILPNSRSTPDGSDAHAFIDRKTGNLYRAASREMPVFDVRYDLSRKEDFNLAIELADPYGNYLRRNYARKTFAGIV